MSIYSFYSIIAMFILFIFYLYLKKRNIHKLNTFVQNNQSEMLRVFLKNKYTHLFLSKYLTDLYTARSYVMDHNISALKETLVEMFQRTYQKQETSDYLTLYFHYFINQNDMQFAEKILKRIQQETDPSLIRYCRWTYQVLAKNETIYIDEMITAIEQKAYHSFPLGVISYLIAVQYERLHDLKNTAIWYYTATTVLQKNEMYYHLSKEKAEKWNQLLPTEETNSPTKKSSPF